MLLKGIPVSPGYASGIATIYDFELQRRLEWPHRVISHLAVESEIHRLPSEAVELTDSGVVAIVVSEHGGRYSHTAIIARSLRIPAITGISNVTSLIRSGMRLLVDGKTGSVVITPSSSDEHCFVERKREYDLLAPSIAVNERLPSVTRDGTNISLRANIGRPHEVVEVAEHNLAGVGLFRAEFLFLESHKRPSFDMQLNDR